MKLIFAHTSSIPLHNKLNLQRGRAFAATAFILLFLVSCASVGTGDKTVVRAEDVQVNSLAFYDAAMQWHFANSTKESPSLYKAFEVFRTKFPPAWKTLSSAIPAYKSGKTGDLANALQEVEKLLVDIRAIWTPTPPSPGGN